MVRSMNEKTAELRDIFVETTGADTVTERQAESPEPSPAATRPPLRARPRGDRRDARAVRLLG